MTPQLALIGCCLFILGLMLLDSRRRTGVSSALWLVVVWVAILASRPVSAWLNLHGGAAPENEMEGNSTDRNVFLLLILAALFVLRKRNVNWRALVSNNRWLFLLYAYLGLSCLWSDFSFVSFKRWFKDFGGVLMVLVILTEKNPIGAIKAVFARVGYLLIPLSVLITKYYPDVGRYFTRWTGEVFYTGVTRGKNELGGTVLVLTLFLVWDFLEMVRKQPWAARKMETVARLLLLIMGIWLFRVANSATSLACAVLGSFALVALGTEFVRKRLKQLFAWSVVAAVFVLLVSTVVDLKANMAEMLGRDPTLHGRTAIWKTVLDERTNPIIGTGYYSFWMGGRSQRIAEKNGYAVSLNQAHNGYLEMYLNGGAIGVCLLIAMLASAGMRIKRHMLIDPGWGGVRLVFWIIIAIHNWSEASFFILGPLWFVLVLATLEYPRRAKGTMGRSPHVHCTNPAQRDRETVSPVGTAMVR